MRIVQLIDSLETGGAEQMAVTYANTLANHIDFSALITTRKEGDLKSQIASNVHYRFLKRTKTLDLKALFDLRSFVVQNQVEFIQAHSSSFLLAVLLKLVYPKIKIVWHDHYGNSEFLHQRKAAVLKAVSFLFFRVIVVNNQLLEWGKTNLRCKKIYYLPNFTREKQQEILTTFLHGEEGKRIVCLANLRPQKNHFLLLEVAKRLKKKHSDWTFHLIGKDFKDDYSSSIKTAIVEADLQDTVFVYGSRNDVSNILEQSTVGILTSKSEGLPVALLEYGFHKLPVVVTNVGEISSIITDENGFLIESLNAEAFNISVCSLIENEDLRITLSENLHQTILENYSEKAILEKYFKILKEQ